MLPKDIGVVVMVVAPLLLLGQALQGSGRRGSPARSDQPTVEISSVKISPERIRTQKGEKPNTATITIEVFHTPLGSDQSVTLNLGSYSSSPQMGVSVKYRPASQEMVLRSGAAGAVLGMVEVSEPEIGGNAAATINVVATLSKPSPGIRIVNDDPSLPSHQATLTIVR